MALTPSGRAAATHSGKTMGSTQEGSRIRQLQLLLCDLPEVIIHLSKRDDNKTQKCSKGRSK